MECVSRESRHPAQRYASDVGGSRADAHPAGRCAPGMGRGLGHHTKRRSPTPTTRCCPRHWRSGRSPGSRSMLPRHLEIIYRDQPASARFGPDPLPRRRGTRAAREPRRGGPGAPRSAWPTWRSSARTAPTAWPPFTPSCCARRRSRIWRRFFPSASATRPTASRHDAGCCWRTRALARTITEAIGDGWITNLSELRKLKPLADDQGFRDAFRKAKREAKRQFADWLQTVLRADRGPGYHLRLPDQAYS